MIFLSIHLDITLPTPSPPVCPPGVPLVNCFANPCDTATCPNFPNSRCVFDTCGGCNAKFFIGRNEITNECGMSYFKLLNDAAEIKYYYSYMYSIH